VNPALHPYVTDRPKVVLADETVPFAGAVAPEQVMGTSQFAPDQPASQVPQLYPVAPTGVHVALCTHGLGAQPVLTRSHVGAVPLQVALVWQVRVALPFRT
jgi:hypothetical protein